MISRKKRRTGPVTRFKKGRVCKKPGCHHRLSIYNSHIYCHIHLGELWIA